MSEMNVRRILQWPVFYTGLLLHGVSFRTIRSDEDTRADWPANVSLDRQDSDGDTSDGVQEAWQRIWTKGRPLHDLKNYPREWIEVVHPKTSARVFGFLLLLTLAFGIAGWIV